MEKSIKDKKINLENDKAISEECELETILHRF